MITVLLPTTNRPTLLRTALRSVADQTAVRRIACLIISENGGNRASAAVCAEFPQLPIRYIYREKPLSPLEHFQQLLQENLPGDFVAILHDDDWWMPTHLAHGLLALEESPDASAYGTAHYVVSSESSMLNCSGNLFPWFAASYPAFAPAWKISRLNVLLGSLLGTLAHYSSFVMRSAAFRQSSSIYDLGNPFDTDRMQIVALARCGPFLFRPTAEVFVRCHGVQECFNFSWPERIQHMCKTSRWIIETSGKEAETMTALFARRSALCPPEAVSTLQALAQKPWCLPTLAELTAPA